MASIQQMTSVAQNCPGFEPHHNTEYALNASTALESCINCKNFQDEICVKNLFDRVLSGLDTL